MKLAELGHEEGVIFRAIGDIIAFCPPLIVTEQQIDEIFDRFGRALSRLTV
jgi:4-aminobutyrate--pyruvate transaminase